jgi:hypothetical protein
MPHSGGPKDRYEARIVAISSAPEQTRGRFSEFTRANRFCRRDTSLPKLGMPVVTTTIRTATFRLLGASFVMWRTPPPCHDQGTTMKSLQHVLWRGALALSLMAVGIGSGLGMPPAERTASTDDCALEARVLVAEDARSRDARELDTTLIVLRRPLSPAG